LRMERKSLLGALNARLKEERARTPAMKKMTRTATNARLKEERARTPAMKKMTRTATNAHLNAKKMTRTATKRKVAKVAEEARDAKVAREVKAVREVKVAREEKVAVVLTMERLLTKRTKVAYSKEARASQSNKEAANGQKESQKKDGVPSTRAPKKKAKLRSELEHVLLVSRTQTKHASNRSATWMALKKRPPSSVTGEHLRSRG